MQPSTVCAHEVPTWIDALSYELRVKIAAHVSTRKNALSLLNLASVSRKQQRAVFSFLDEKYVEPEPWKRGCSPYALSAWRRIFINLGVKEVDMSNFEGHDVPDFTAEDFVYLLNAPTLRKLTIPDIPWFLTTASGSSVVDICLVLRQRCPQQLLTETLQMLSPKRLTLKFDWRQSKECIAKENEQILETIVASCPKLGYLEVDGFFCRRCLLRFNWSFISQVPSLREITVCTVSMADSSILLLRHGNTGTIHTPVEVIHGSITTEQFPAVVTELLDLVLVQAQNFRDFPSYPKLRKLECSVSVGAETILVDICRTSPLLHTLRIEGQPQPFGFQNVAQGFALRLVEAAPKLVDLGFIDFHIATAELKAVLRSLGSRLEIFAMSTELNEGDESDLLATILETVVARNNNLRELHVCNRKDTLHTELPLGPNGLALLSFLCVRQPLFRLKVSGCGTPAHDCATFSWR